jgi:endonuclease G, mitochondrial
MALLTQPEVITLIQALIAGGVAGPENRGALFQFMPPGFIAGIPGGAVPNVQLLNDIGRMNVIERFANGDVPLQIYLQNADLLLSAAEEQQKIIRATLSLVVQRASGAPRVDTANVPETNEKIIHVDDTVTFAFMEGGVKAAAAVMKLRVPRFENGQPRTKNGSPMNYLGTGWLLSDTLMMTNHHVVNARNDGEANAPESDLRLQAQGTTVQFDFDSDGLAGSQVAALSLEIWEAGSLDYAVLRIPASGRTPLRRAAKAIEKSDGTIPVNIIQHPGGRSKRYGIRNNLVSASTATELRYFTDTESGSSGSPVFNDRWEVVALHRASTYVENVQFQGKPTAYVNIGTHLPSIIADLRNRRPDLAAEIGA